MNLERVVAAEVLTARMNGKYHAYLQDGCSQPAGSAAWQTAELHRECHKLWVHYLYQARSLLGDIRSGAIKDLRRYKELLRRRAKIETQEPQPPDRELLKRCHAEVCAEIRPASIGVSALPGEVMVPSRVTPVKAPCEPLQACFEAGEGARADGTYRLEVVAAPVVETVQGPKRVFISYAHDTVRHAAMVRGLADTLRAGGLVTILDQYESPGPSTGWPFWMEKGLQDADYVLCVCTALYRCRIDGHEAPADGKGAAWEGNLIRNLLYDSKSNSHRFIPVLFDSEPDTSVPLMMKHFRHHRLPAGFQDLYHHLAGQASSRRQ